MRGTMPPGCKPRAGAWGEAPLSRRLTGRLCVARISLTHGVKADTHYAMQADRNVGQAFLPAQDAQTGASAPPSHASSKKKAWKSVLTEDPDLA